MRKVQLINSAAEHLQSAYKLIAISQLISACLDIAAHHPFQESHRKWSKWLGYRILDQKVNRKLAGNEPY